MGTVYFSEDMEDTTAQVQETLQDYNALIAKLTEKQKKQVIQSIGKIYDYFFFILMYIMPYIDIYEKCNNVIYIFFRS